MYNHNLGWIMELDKAIASLYGALLHIRELKPNFAGHLKLGLGRIRMEKLREPHERSPG